MHAYALDYMTAAAASSRLLKNVKIRAFIEMLKNEKLNQMYFSADDLVQRYMDIAFADIGDVATFTERGIELRANFDPTTVKSIKNTKYGYSIQMLNPFKAMEWLDKYFEEEKNNTGVIMLAPVLPEEEEEIDECDMDTTTETN